MARRDLSRDSSSFASGELDYVLRREIHKLNGEDQRVTLDEALHSAPVAEHHSSRDITRVLFISQNTELLNPTRQTLDGYINVSDVFDEVHLIVMRTGLQPRQSVFRPAKNVWIYTVAARHWWQLVPAAQKMMREQLLFADGFRPDLIVARDPRESALAALWAAEEFSRPAQLHVTQKLLGKRAPQAAKISMVRSFIARYTIPKFLSIRVSSQIILTQVKKLAETTDVAMLPQHNPYESIVQVRQTLDLKQKYPQYIFNMLCVTAYQDETALLSMLDAAQGMLQNQRISLIMVGDGPAMSAFKKRAKFLGVEKQLVYIKDKAQAVHYMKAAQLLLVPETSPASDEIAWQAAYAGIAMVATVTDQREEVFVHNESAYLCAAMTTAEMATGIESLMNNYTMRVHIAEQATLAAQTYFHEDPEVYKSAYRSSIESALFT